MVENQKNFDQYQKSEFINTQPAINTSAKGDPLCILPRSKQCTNVMARQNVHSQELKIKKRMHIQWVNTISCFVQYLLLSFLLQLLALLDCTLHHHVLFFLGLWLCTVIKLETLFPDIPARRVLSSRFFARVCSQTTVCKRNTHYYSCRQRNVTGI